MATPFSPPFVALRFGFWSVFELLDVIFVGFGRLLRFLSRFWSVF